jgi:Protein of unknown function (DUF2796)
MFRHTSCAALAFLAAMTACPVLAQQGAHNHGVVALVMAIDKETITLELEAPLDSLVGFERAPRNDAERKRVQHALERLKSASTLFTIDPDAQCKLKEVELTSKVLSLRPQPTAPASTEGHSHGEKKHTPEEHADLNARFVFGCVQTTTARFVDVKLFTAFTRIRTVNVQVASPAGQVKRTLRKDSARLTWSR